MGEFFDLESPFMNFLSFLTDILILSVLWIICSLPIITMGASTTAVYYVAINKINNREGYLVKSFFKSFKQNFKQSIIVDIMIKLMLGFVGLNIYSLGNIMQVNDVFRFMMYSVQFLLLFETVFFSIYGYAIIAKFELTLKEVFKFAFLLSHKHIFTTLIIIIIGGTLFGISYLFTNILYLIALPGIYIFMSSYFLIKVFKKYTTEFDD